MKDLTHSLDPEVAKIVGVNAALVFNKIRHYCIYHESENTNFHDGMHWSYNTHKGMTKQFEYLSTRQIRTALEKLLKAGFIISGNYNKFKNDRTLWYTFGPRFQMTSKSNGYDTEVKSTYDIEVTALPISTNKDPSKQSAQGSFLDPNWKPPGGLGGLYSELGLNQTALKQELEKFRDYWLGVSGHRGRKRDWTATWRNWLRNSNNNRRNYSKAQHDRPNNDKRFQKSQDLDAAVIAASSRMGSVYLD